MQMQNCRIWGTEDHPHAYIENPTHPKRITVWCGFWYRFIIGPFFFENEQDEVVTVNGYRPRAMLNEFLFTKIEEEDTDNTWFQQDSALYLKIAFSAAATSELQFDTVGLLFVGSVKDKCYADKPETIDALKCNIRDANGEIQLHTIEKCA